MESPKHTQSPQECYESILRLLKQRNIAGRFLRDWERMAEDASGYAAEQKISLEGSERVLFVSDEGPAIFCRNGSVFTVIPIPREIVDNKTLEEARLMLNAEYGKEVTLAAPAISLQHQRVGILRNAYFDRLRGMLNA